MSTDDSARRGAPPTGVSVVVPAYNAGPYLDRCLDSLRNQTLDRSRYDVIVVDDGSTDGTGERLDRAALEDPDLFRVTHIPNSGWPGRPRNVGTELSTREYVFYVDADDWLLPEALRLALDRATQDDADIVMIRNVGNGRAVPQAIYEGGDRCTSWRETPGVFSTLTCQKMFRRQFLRERDVRFSEGKVRLEDFIFMTTAYLRAERISIVGSQPCYVFELREDGGNLTAATRATESEYFASVEKMIDIVLGETEPGPQQDLALDRVVRSELIGPLSRPPLLGKPLEVQAEAFAHGRRLLRDKVPASAVARQDVHTQYRARLIERGDLSAMTRLIEEEKAVALSSVITGVSWQDEQLRIDLTLAMERDGHAVRLRRDGGTLLLPAGAGDDDAIDVTRLFPRSGGHLHLRSRDRNEEWRVRITVHVARPEDSSQTLSWTGSALVDARTAAGGRPLRPGVWDIVLAFGSCGYGRQSRPRVPEGSDPVEPPTVVRDGWRVRPYWTRVGTLAISMRTAEGKSPRPGTERIDMGTQSPHSAGRRGLKWRPVARRAARRLAPRLARRAGVTITDIGPGVALLTRRAKVDVAPLVKGRSWVVSKRAQRGAAPVPQPLGERHWVVPAVGESAVPLEVDPVGSRGWLVSRPDAHPLAPVTLENQTLQYLAARHVTWLLARYDVDIVLDVGANTGQYGQHLRDTGYRGRIVSFEPVPRFADAVEELARDDELWTLQRIALGAEEGAVPIRVQRTFSSLLPASDYGKGRFATLRDFADKDDQVVEVPLRRLDSVLAELLPAVTRADGGPPRVFLKMDTQGFDLQAFRGLGERVHDIVGLQSEVALLLIYEGMPRMPEALATYEGAGFEISGLYPVTTEPDGRVIEYDCVMVRASAAPR